MIQLSIKELLNLNQKKSSAQRPGFTLIEALNNDLLH